MRFQGEKRRPPRERRVEGGLLWASVKGSAPAARAQ